MIERLLPKTGISAEYPRFKAGILQKIKEAYAGDKRIVTECEYQIQGCQY